MSEFNDFPRRPDDGTFDSCFEAIKDCHYYVLLVGGRKGSEYKDGVSVTQQEYRTAADLAKQGKITLVVFVRTEVDLVLSERRVLWQSGAAANVGNSQPKSRVLEDPDFVEAFIDEIKATELGRVGNEGPAGNVWYYRFATFAELVDALRVNLHLYRTVRRQALLENLKWEIEENFSGLMENHKGMPFPNHKWLSGVRRHHKLSSEDLLASVSLSRDQARNIAVFWMGLPGGERLKSLVLQEAILSGEFLIFDQATNRLARGQVYHIMQSLFASLDSYRSVRELLQQPIHMQVYESVFQAVRAKRGQIAVPEHQLVFLFRIHDIMVDIFRLSAALLRYILDPTDEIHVPALSPVTPIDAEVARIEASRATHEHVEQWVTNGYIWGLITAEQVGTQADFMEAIAKYPWLREMSARESEKLASILQSRLDEFQQILNAQGSDAAFDWLWSMAHPEKR